MPDFFFPNICSILVLRKEGKKQKREERVAGSHSLLNLLYLKKKVIRSQLDSVNNFADLLIGHGKEPSK